MSDITDALERAIVPDVGSTELACAKINLALHVTGRRADGYHSLESLVVFADFADVVTAAPADDGRMRLMMKGPFAEKLAESTSTDANLVIKAANALMKVAGKKTPPATRLTLTKKLPMGAGLGGGSADAAATLRLLNRTWNLRLSDERLAEIGLKLGADVPMCLVSKPLIAGGIGENIALVPGMPSLAVVLAKPKTSVKTEEVFAKVTMPNGAPLPAPPPRFRTLLDVVFWLRQTRNDLAAPALAITKFAGSAAKALMRDPECLLARMSGSGSAAYGIFGTMDAAERAAARLRDDKPAWWVVAARTIAS